jgi:hypothetical protein
METNGLDGIWVVSCRKESEMVCILQFYVGFLKKGKNSNFL